MQWSADGPAGGFSTSAPWEAMQDDWPMVNVAAQTGDPASLLATYRDVIALRNANPALRDGATAIVDGGAEPVIGWLRTTPGQTLLTVVNVGDTLVDTYGLTLDVGPLCTSMTARLLATVGGNPAAPVAAPVITAGGGLDGYRPLSELAPRSGYVIALDPAP
jgi:glycosidase